MSMTESEEAAASEEIVQALVDSLHAASREAAIFTCSGSIKRPASVSFQGQDGGYDPVGLRLPGKAVLCWPCSA